MIGPNLSTATTTYLASIPSPPRGVVFIGPLPLRAYAICIIIGIIVAVWWGGRRFVARGGRPGRVTDIAVYCVPFGLVGGRLYHVITDPELYFTAGRNPWNAFAIWDGGLGIWGAIALGGVGALIGCRRYKVPFTAFADAVAPAIVTAQAIGRMGNYFNQELFGKATHLPWALEVFLRTPGGVSGAVAQCGTGEFDTTWIKAVPTVSCGTYHPTFLYELIWDLLVAVVVVWADRRFTLGAGRAFGVYVAGYTLGRTWIENLRIDDANHFLGLRINVFVSVIVFICAVTFLVIRRRAGREDPDLVRGLPTRGQEDARDVAEKESINQAPPDTIETGDSPGSLSSAEEADLEPASPSEHSTNSTDSTADLSNDATAATADSTAESIAVSTADSSDHSTAQTDTTAG